MDGGGVPVGRYSAWLWRRFRRSYHVAYGVSLYGGLLFILVALGWWQLSIVLELAMRESLVALASSALAIGIGTVAAVCHPMLRPVVAFGRGDDGDRHAVWRCALTAAPLVARRAAVVTGVLWLATLPPLVLSFPSVGLLGAVAVATTAFAGLVVGGVGVSIVGALLLRPVVNEAAPTFGEDDTVDGPRTSLGTALVVTGLCVALPAVLTGGTAFRLADSADERIVVVMVGTASWAAVLYVAMRSLFGRGLLAPLDQLTSATERVRRGDFTQIVPIVSTDELGALARSFNDMQQGLREREALHAAFGSYVDPALAQRLIESGSSVFEGEELEVTVLFADVRDFTSYAEDVAPAVAVEQLNRLFDVVVPVLHEHGGHANHYLGDGLLAVFGAPQPMVRHADAAVAAAVAIQQRVGATFGAALRIGIGVNTGPVIAGTVGGGGRHEFTVIGDTVNVAARVEQLTKETGDAILVTEATRTALSSPAPATTDRGPFDLKGKSARITVHAVG